MLRAGLCSLALAFLISACSSGTPPVPLDVASCIEVTVEGPATAVEGQGLTAKLFTKNVCNEAIELPVAVATTVDDGVDSGVEVSFGIFVTNPEEPAGQGYLVRWGFGDEVADINDLDDTQTFVTLAPNEALERTFTWKGYQKDGILVPQGDYVLFGEFFYSPLGIRDWQSTETILGMQPFKIVAE